MLQKQIRNFDVKRLSLTSTWLFWTISLISVGTNVFTTWRPPAQTNAWSDSTYAGWQRPCMYIISHFSVYKHIINKKTTQHVCLNCCYFNIANPNSWIGSSLAWQSTAILVSVSDLSYMWQKCGSCTPQTVSKQYVEGVCRRANTQLFRQNTYVYIYIFQK